MRATRAVLPAALALAMAGCSALIDPDDGPLYCAVAPGASDPCPTGLTCMDGQCLARTPGVDACPGTEELCNGIDDDCDGEIDEGHDRDGDGFTWCGGGVIELADCDDSSPDVHPADPSRGIAAAREVCDGLDNDCNGVADDTGDGPLCPAGQECIDRSCVDPNDCLRGRPCETGFHCDLALSPPRCVAGEGCRTAGCPDGQVCDGETGACVTRQPLGLPCLAHGECASGHCVSREALGLGAADEGVCAQPCCSDAQCGGDSICWSSGTGARACVPSVLVDRQRGTGGPGASCTDGATCQSGLCFTAQSTCLANCGHDSQCASGQVCTVEGPFSRPDSTGQVQVVCKAPVGSRSTGSLCWSNSDCRSGLCASALCSGGCRTTSDCGSSMYCTWLTYTDLSPPRYFQICYPRSPFGHGSGGQGARCSANGDCIDDACVREACASSCCSDDDCASSGTRCRAIRFGAARYEMHCVP